MTDREETYHRMCADPRIQEALKWVPKVGDEISILHSEYTLEFWQTKIGDVKKISYFSGSEFGWKNGPLLSKEECAWLPTSDDLVDRLSLEINEFTWQTSGRLAVEFEKNSFYRESFYGEYKEALLLALMWTKGMKWKDGKWERRAEV